ncbi:serine/threonine-protein kinase [Fischerella sp. JS2]|uniref:serine/threonine-protein kinase n=1 Tax=Fischerella sp. JS2 TaxID=2597771 RepID=UPI0028E7DC8D|nr:serine/threonine-protein kinase [Fischerella sp. JS2]
MVWNPGQPLFGGRYVINRRLGEGGIGITYLAKNRRGELRVIKTLKEQILNDPVWIPHQAKLRHDFRDEALRLALCRHPHIVQVENVFDDENLPCMAMEYIEGEDLAQRLRRVGKLPEAEALLYIRQIGDALSLVHEKGLLHRDLKPSNIMIRNGKSETVLIDFGIARQFIPGAIQVHTQALTDGYAPPEQYIPDAERGEYIDVYALAGTLYTLLTGQLPMPAPARLQNFTLQPPKELNGNISNRVNEAIMKGMALNYKFRPQSVQEWLNLLQGTGTIPHQEPTSKRQSQKNTEAVPRNWQCVKTLTSHSDWVNSITFSPDGRLLASSSRDNKIKLWQLSIAKEIRTLTSPLMFITSVIFSPDGQLLASECRDKKIKLWQLSTSTEIYSLKGHLDEVTSVTISPDGKMLASGSNDKTIKIWQLSTGREICTLTGHMDVVTSVAFSPDGRFLASGSWDNTIKLWQVSTGINIWTFPGHSQWVNSVAFSPDGKLLASASRDNTIKLWQVNTGIEIFTLKGHSDWVTSVAFNYEGQIIASGSHDKTIKIWQGS